MTDAPLHPEVEAMIRRLPMDACIMEIIVPEVRAIALLAAEKARESLRDSFVDVLIETDAAWSVSEARAVAEEAIRRGTP